MVVYGDDDVVVILTIACWDGVLSLKCVFLKVEDDDEQYMTAVNIDGRSVCQIVFRCSLIM